MSVTTSLPSRASRAIVSSHREASEPSAWEYMFVAAALFLSTNALMPVVFGSTGDGLGAASGESTDPVTHRAWLLIIVVLLIALVRAGADAVAALFANPAILGLMYLTLVSTVWSVERGVTIKDGLEFSLSTVLGLYVGTRFGLHRLVRALSWLTLAILILSVVFAVVVPRYGLDHVRGNAWRGVFVTKNGLGRMMVEGFAIWGARTFAGERRRLRNWVILGAFAFVAYQSDSRTAWGVGGLMLGVFVLARALARVDRRFLPVKGLIVTSLAICLAISAVSLKFMLAVVGSDYSLTGRSGIWRAVWHAIQSHVWLGYGFDAFWDSPVRTFEISRAAGTVTPHAHDGFLDLLLALGIVGLACFVIAFVTVWRRTLTTLRKEAGAAGLFPFVFLSLLVLYNLTESSLLGARAFEWIVFAAVAGAVTPSRSLAPSRRTGAVERLSRNVIRT